MCTRIKIAMCAALGAPLAWAAAGIPALLGDDSTPASGGLVAARLEIASDRAPQQLAGCDAAGVRVTIMGEDADAPALDSRDLATYKYRRDGDRSPTFTVTGGSMYVHGVRGFLPADTGTTSLSLLTIRVEGEEGGYRLARGGRSVLRVRSIGAEVTQGEFEADVSRVDDVTREPAFGTPVVRVRGTYCLQVAPRDPSDTGP